MHPFVEFQPGVFYFEECSLYIFSLGPDVDLAVERLIRIAGWDVDGMGAFDRVQINSPEASMLTGVEWLCGSDMH
jgi:hypothetical protein